MCRKRARPVAKIEVKYKKCQYCKLPNVLDKNINSVCYNTACLLKFVAENNNVNKIKINNYVNENI